MQGQTDVGGKDYFEDAEAILNDTHLVDGVEVKGFSFGDLINVTPELEKIYNRLVELKFLEKGELGLTDQGVMQIFFSCAPSCLKLMASATKLSEEKLRKLTKETAIKILASIWKLNEAFLKNIFALCYFVAEGRKEVPEGV